MKSSSKLLLSAAAVLAATVWVQKRTKQIQKKAGEEGRHIPFGPYEAVLKRPLDVLVVGMALVPLAPVMGITALLVKRKSGTPVIFKQERPGKDGRIFTLCKFRTMTDETDEEGQLLPDEQRLTEFGKWLRSTSLDELPEVFNILKGDMSLVGPRPLLAEYLPRYDRVQRKRHDVRPGLTGLAQVNGRNGISWEEKFKDDVKYIKRITFWGDIKILKDTVWVVLKKDGISSGSSTTMEFFMGSGSG